MRVLVLIVDDDERLSNALKTLLEREIGENKCSYLASSTVVRILNPQKNAVNDCLKDYEGFEKVFLLINAHLKINETDKRIEGKGIALMEKLWVSLPVNKKMPTVILSIEPVERLNQYLTKGKSKKGKALPIIILSPYHSTPQDTLLFHAVSLQMPFRKDELFDAMKQSHKPWENYLEDVRKTISKLKRAYIEQEMSDFRHSVDSFVRQEQSYPYPFRHTGRICQALRFLQGAYLLGVIKPRDYCEVLGQIADIHPEINEPIRDHLSNLYEIEKDFPISLPLSFLSSQIQEKSKEAKFRILLIDDEAITAGWYFVLKKCIEKDKTFPKPSIVDFETNPRNVIRRINKEKKKETEYDVILLDVYFGEKGPIKGIELQKRLRKKMEENTGIPFTPIVFFTQYRDGFWVKQSFDWTRSSDGDDSGVDGWFFKEWNGRDPIVYYRNLRQVLREAIFINSRRRILFEIWRILLEKLSTRKIISNITRQKLDFFVKEAIMHRPPRPRVRIMLIGYAKENIYFRVKSDEQYKSPAMYFKEIAHRMRCLAAHGSFTDNEFKDIDVEICLWSFLGFIHSMVPNISKDEQEKIKRLVDDYALKLSKSLKLSKQQIKALKSWDSPDQYFSSIGEKAKSKIDCIIKKYRERIQQMEKDKDMVINRSRVGQFEMLVSKILEHIRDEMKGNVNPNIIYQLKNEMWLLSIFGSNFEFFNFIYQSDYQYNYTARFATTLVYLKLDDILNKMADFDI